VFMTTDGPRRPIRARISPTEAAEDLTQSMTVGQRVKSGGRGPDSGAPREEGHRARPGDSRVNALRTADIDQMYGKLSRKLSAQSLHLVAGSTRPTCCTPGSRFARRGSRRP
jgi:hypothetical protein